jgi:hypothetical protein
MSPYSLQTDKQWYQNQIPLANPFPDTHHVAYFLLDRITYDEPTIPPFRTIAPNRTQQYEHILYP